MLTKKRARSLMAFSEVDRVVYKVNPLEEVICQLRFPKLLRLQSDPPVAFQEKIRDSYPNYKSSPTIEIAPGIRANVPAMTGREMPFMSKQLGHEFGSRDGSWRVTLDSESLTLICKRYTCWEDFRNRLGDALASLQAVYSLSYFVRTGLRYQNIIRRSQLGLADVEWSELLKPWITGPFSSPDTKNETEHCMLQMIIRLPSERSRVLVTSGTAKHQASGEECYLIDADFFTEQETETADAFERLDYLNDQSNRFFHWCINERLHDVLLSYDRGE